MKTICLRAPWTADADLNWFSRKHQRLCRLTILDVDHFLAYKLATGSVPPTLKSISFSLRAFLSYAESRKWCTKGIASLSRGPAIGRFSIRRQGRNGMRFDSCSNRLKATVDLICALRQSYHSYQFMHYVAANWDRFCLRMSIGIRKHLRSGDSKEVKFRSTHFFLRLNVRSANTSAEQDRIVTVRNSS
jgi:hypothetical protein